MNLVAGLVVAFILIIIGASLEGDRKIETFGVVIYGLGCLAFVIVIYNSIPSVVTS